MRKFLILLLYRLLPAAAFPLLLLYVVWRCLRDPRYLRRVTERFGFLPPQYQRTVPDSVWLHAVSVGEVLSSIHLINRLRESMPGSPVFLSCTTLAGREVAETRLKDLVDGIFYAPIDYVSVVRRVLRRIRPSAIIVLETEIWPNLYREAKRSGAALVVVNGRISPKALPRYTRLAWFFRTVLALPDALLVQSEDDRVRYIAAGAPPERVFCAGNLKYDFDPRVSEPPAPLTDWLCSAPGPLFVAASTVGPEYDGDVDEDDVVFGAYRQLTTEFPNLRLLVAPRKPERFDAVAAKLTEAGIAFARRSALPCSPVSVLLLDSLGELGSIFVHADVVFMGGTLADRGGHNILEPASAGCAIVVGPHLENFAEIQRHFRQGKGFFEIGGPAGLAPAVSGLLSDSVRRSELGRRAQAIADSERGATGRAVKAIVDAREAAVPTVVSYGPLKPVLWLLSRLWILGGVLKRRFRRSGRLQTPVISIGGLSMGGSGKTPLVRHLARHLHEAGIEVAVLTRGYRRRSAEPLSVIPRGENAPVDITGDEAQMLVRDGAAHLGVSVDRLAAGRAIERRFRPGLFLLDDGFQHTGVYKDMEIVMLDGLDPFAGGFVFPRGRLRGLVSELARADAIVIARAGGRPLDGVHRVIRSVNPHAPVYHAELKPLYWTDLVTGARHPAETFSGRTVACFCGLANPESFRRTLETLGCRIISFDAFPDHHRYSRAEIEALLRRARDSGAEQLVTTEKDAVKLGNTPLYYLSVGLSVDQELLRIVQTKAKVTIA